MSEPGEIIEVCQDCGKVIDPQVVTAPWGDRYEIRMCLRDECIADRALTRTRLFDFDLPRGARTWMWNPIIINPAPDFRIVGA
jgi:hypothetical protein